MRTRIASILLSLGLCLALQAQQFEVASVASNEDLTKALQELSALQESIASEKIPLSKELNDLESELSGKQKDLERAQRARDNEVVDLNVLKSEVKSRRDEFTYVTGLLTEYMRLFETRVHISEAKRFEEPIASTKAIAESPDKTETEKLEALFGMLHRGIDRLEAQLGGEIFEGSGLAPNGVYETGKFAAIGPVVVFASESGAAGVADLQIGSPEATVQDIGAEATASIAGLVQSGSGQLPVDASGGNALKISATEDSFLEHIKKGGPVMIPLLGLGVLAVIVAVLRWLSLSKIALITPRDMQVILSHINENKKDEAIAHAKRLSGALGDMMVVGIEHCAQKKELIEEVMYEKMISTKPTLEKLLPIIALTAATAPLLGLLGTVTGMINTFNLITVFGTGDPRMLSGGISEALITTKFGLVVAVPALLLHAVVSRKAKGIMGNMEQSAVAFINGLPSSKIRKELS